jgi:preprotein translocase subunit SecD
VNQNTLALFHKLVCTPDNSSTWKDQVGYTTADDYDNPSTQIVSCDRSGNKYALDVARVQGTQISDATTELSTTSNQWEVTLRLNSAGASAFGALTLHQYKTWYRAAQAGNQDDYWLDTIAVVLDGNVVTAPKTDGPIPGGNAQITGNFTQAQAAELAAQLQSGALPADFRVSAVGTLAPSASSQAAAG